MTRTRRDRSRLSPAAVAFVVSAAASLALPQTAWATNWAADVSGATASSAQSLAVAAPSNVTSSCPSPTSSKTVKVTWSAISHASFAVYQSTTSATSGYSLVASGVTTNSWTSGTLSNSSYWYEVVAYYSANWTSAKSAATAQRTIRSTTPVCS